jgi:hypothetical protein
MDHAEKTPPDDKKAPEQPPPCPRCGGAGQVVLGPPLGSCSGPQIGPCPECNGRGYK